jgi:NAD-dependent DNA ligase
MATSNRNVLLIANPAAQRGHGAEAARIAHDLLCEWVGDEAVTLAMTDFAGHAVELAAEASSDILAGKTIVISGNFSISRDEMKRTIEANGGRNSSSVSGKTSFLLAGSKPGPEKVKKAQDLGVRIISEEEFFEMLPAGEHVVEDNAEPTLF